MTRIVFMGTPAFAVPVLRQLIAAYEVIGVVTQPDRPAGRGRQLRPSPVKEVAEAAGIPLFQPRSLRKRERAETLHAWAPDLIVVAAFGQILRPHVLELPPLGCLNVHASLLPRWRGASPIQAALLAGDTTTGISLMQMDEGLDTGPVYARHALAIGPQETAATLHDRLADLGAAVVAEHLPAIIDGRLQPEPQPDEATYAPLIKKEDGVLDWSEPAVALDRRVRAMTPWPGAVTNWQGRALKIWQASPRDHLPAGPPGTVVDHDGDVVVRTGAGGLRLETLQLAGRRPTPIEDFVRGQPDLIGACLG